MTRAGQLAACAAIAATAGSFFAWQTDSTAGSVAGASAARLSGADLFHSKGCATCHTTATSHALIDGFPPLVDVAQWAADRRPGLSAQQYVAESIRTPDAFESPVFAGSVGPTAGMPQLGLTEAEIDALVVHLLQG